MTASTNTALHAEFNEIFIGRQPIYDRQMQTIAYELLYRNNQQNQATIDNADIASSQVIVNAFMEIGFDTLIGTAKAFINFPRSLLVQQFGQSLPKDRIVIEVLEDVDADAELVAEVQQLADLGYCIALDDFEYRPCMEPLIALASIIKIDVLALNEQQLHEHVTLLKPHGLKLLAEKVEDHAMHQQCLDLGFDYFQGYFFTRPQIIQGSKLPASRIAILQLITRLFQPEVPFKEIENTISQDAALSYKLIKIINSAAFSLSRKIDSLGHALTILGLKNIRNWVSMIAFSGMDDKPSELVRSAMLRARMCEQLAIHLQLPDTDTYFTVGLFSNLDALMDQTLRALVEPLPLASAVTEALLERRGLPGRILAAVIAYEQGQWQDMQVSQLSGGEIKSAYAEAVRWSNEMSQQLAL